LLFALHPDADGPSDEDASLLQFAGDLAAVAVHRAHVATQLEQRASRDPVTGLPNRHALDELLDATDGDDRSTVTAVLVDVDGSRIVNRTLGPHWTDELTRGVAQRLADHLGDAGVLIRLEGLTFVVVSRSDDHARAPEELARRLVASFQLPFVVDDRSLFLSARAGVAVAPRLSSTSSLLRDAALALDEAPRRGDSGARVVRFDDALRRREIDRLQAVGELRDAVARGDFELHVQPVMSLRDGLVAGARALTYWRRTDRSLLAPAELDAVARDAGLAGAVWAMSVRAACAQLRAWRETLPAAPPFLSVPLSTLELADEATVAEARDALQQWDLPPGQLVVELTDSFRLERSNVARDALRRLHDAGAAIALADFGGGRSTLARLGDLPVQAVTLDPALTATLAGDARRAAVAEGVVRLAHALELQTVASGVGSRADAEALRAAGCDAGQGPYWSDPLPVAAFGRWLAARR
jgi:diguanylate cyclase (GGDEF)-like protein